MAWTEADKLDWFKKQTLKRSYQADVVPEIQKLANRFDVQKYGALEMDPVKYPVFLLKSRNFDPKKKTVLITGGVHGYETSGVHGALAFFDREAERYERDFNFVCAPCISPWAYETVNRWNAKAIDPNRSFRDDSPCEESRLFVEALKAHSVKPYVHIDLHETTDTDNSVFRPALEQRDGITIPFSEIPDGFYVVGDSENPCSSFQKAIIDAVRKITHIAPADENGNIIGDKAEQDGVINYPVKSIFLCSGLTDAKFTTTTEVYPDSPKATAEICEKAQVVAITGGLDYLLSL